MEENLFTRILVRIKYPKFILLALTFLIAYLLLSGKDVLPFYSYLASLGLVGVFIMGIFFAYGFTAAPATAMLIILAQDHDILLIGFIAGIGAWVGDILIFKFIEDSFSDEIGKLSKEKFMLKINSHTPAFMKRYFMPVVAAFVIASPLPDEIGIALFEAFGNVSFKVFAIMSYLLNTAGVYGVLLIGATI